MEEEEITREVSLGLDYGMAICHHQIIIPPRDKWRMEAARALACLCYNSEGKGGRSVSERRSLSAQMGEN